MGLFAIAAGVFFGNMLSAAFLWGLWHAFSVRDGQFARSSVLAALGLPLVFGLLAIIAFEGLPAQYAWLFE